MRTSKLVRKLIGIASLFVKSFYFDDNCLIVRVRPSWRKPRCSGCEKHRPGYDHRDTPVRWVHLGIGATRIILEYTQRRVECPDCKVRVELVPWARADSRFTRPFEEMTAYLAQITNKTEVSKMMGISWRTVGNIVARIVAERLDPERLDGLVRIGIDELSFRKRHRYITTVVDHDKHRIVWAAEGKNSETLDAFFDELGEERAGKIEIVTIDMSAAFIKSIKAKVPKAQIVFDLFHVLKLAAIQKHNAPIYRAYLLKESLAAVFEEASVDAAEKELERWLSWASRSRLKPFVTTAKTIRRHKDSILAYVETKLTNGIVEGFNNKLRMIVNRAFGFHSADALKGMLFLCCGGVTVNPALPGPWCSW